MVKIALSHSSRCIDWLCWFETAWQGVSSPADFWTLQQEFWTTQPVSQGEEEEEEGIRAAQQGFWGSQKALANKTRHHTRLRYQSLHLPALLTFVCCQLHGALKTMQIYRRCDAHLQNIIALAGRGCNDLVAFGDSPIHHPQQADDAPAVIS